MILCMKHIVIRHKLSGQVVFRTFINFSHNYSLLMQFTTDAVQTVKVVELVMVELVSDSSKQWSLIKIQNIWVELF